MARQALLILLLVCNCCVAQSGSTASPKNGSISGSVVRADNSQPIKRAHVSIEPSVEQSAVGLSSAGDEVTAYQDRMLEAETDETGHFSFPSVPPGDYHVYIEKTGFVSQHASAANPGLIVTVQIGEPAKSIDVKLKPGGAITGHVLNEDGEPMPEVTVEAMRYQYNEGKRGLVPLGQAQTNDLGEYRIFGLEPQKYYVRARVRNGFIEYPSGAKPPTKAKAQQTYWPAFFPDAKSVSAAAAIPVAAGSEQHADFNLAPGAAFQVSGRVLGIPASGKFAYAEVMLVNRDDFEPAGIATVKARNPIFAIDSIPPGKYVLTAVAAQAPSGEMPPDLLKMRTAHKSVVVEGANISGLVVELQPPHPVVMQGKIRLDPAPTPSPDLRRLYVTFDSPDADNPLFMDEEYWNSSQRPTSEGPVAADGTFKLKLTGNIQIQPHLNARSRGFEDYYTKSVLISGRDVTESGVQTANMVPGATLELIVSPFGARVEGVVLDANKKPVVGAVVACVPEARLRDRHELYVTDTTNQQGHYVLRGLRPGTYKLFAFDEIDPGAIYSPEFLKPFEDFGETLNLQERETATKPLQVLHQKED